MVEVSKKGNVEKGVALQKKGEAAKWQFWKTSWCHSWSTITLLPSSFEAFAFPHQITFHKDLNLFTVILSSWLPFLTWRTQDASWWPRWGWQARRRWCRHWCQRPSEGSHSATSAPGLASHISLQRRIGFSTAIVFGWGMVESTSTSTQARQ